MSKWVAVSDELPPPGAKPVVVTNGKAWAIGRYYRARWGYMTGWDVVGFEVNEANITHWHELSQLPGVDSGEQLC